MDSSAVISLGIAWAYFLLGGSELLGTKCLIKKPTIAELKSSCCPLREGHLRYSCQAVFAVADESVANGIAGASVPAGIWEAGCDLRLTIPSCKLGEATAQVAWEV